MTSTELSTIAAIAQAVFAAASVVAAIAAIIAANGSARAQKRVAEMALRPWVVINSPCYLTVPCANMPLAIRQGMAVLGSSPALDVRTLISAELVAPARAASWLPRNASTAQDADTRIGVLLPSPEAGYAESMNAHLFSSDDEEDLRQGRKVLMVGVSITYRDLTLSEKDKPRTSTFIGAYTYKELNARQGHVDPSHRGISAR